MNRTVQTVDLQMEPQAPSAIRTRPLIAVQSPGAAAIHPRAPLDPRRRGDLGQPLHPACARRLQSGRTAQAQAGNRQRRKNRLARAARRLSRRAGISQVSGRNETPVMPRLVHSLCAAPGRGLSERGPEVNSRAINYSLGTRQGPPRTRIDPRSWFIYSVDVGDGMADRCPQPLARDEGTLGLAGFTATSRVIGLTIRSMSSIGIAPSRTSSPMTIAPTKQRRLPKRTSTGPAYGISRLEPSAKVTSRCSHSASCS